MNPLIDSFYHILSTCYFEVDKVFNRQFSLGSGIVRSKNKTV